MTSPESTTLLEEIRSMSAKLDALLALLSGRQEDVPLEDRVGAAAEKGHAALVSKGVHTQWEDE